MTNNNRKIIYDNKFYGTIVSTHNQNHNVVIVEFEDYSNINKTLVINLTWDNVRLF